MKGFMTTRIREKPKGNNLTNCNWDDDEVNCSFLDRRQVAGSAWCFWNAPI